MNFLELKKPLKRIFGLFTLYLLFSIRCLCADESDFVYTGYGCYRYLEDQEGCEYTPVVEPEVISPIPYTTPFIIPYLQYRGGDGLGYDDGYASAGTFLALYSGDSHSYPFIDVQLSRVDKGRFAANGGFGWRLFSNSYEEMIGANIFYDLRHFSEGNLHQIGLGLELLGKCWDVRVNGYIPVGNRNGLLKDTTIFDYSGGFILTRDRFIRGLWGVDVELGSWILSCKCVNLYAGVGPYFYSACCCTSLVGGMGRLEAWICDWLRLQFYVFHDHIFHTNVQGEITVSWTLPCALKCLRCLFLPVYRNRIIVVDDVCCWQSNF